jgi:serine/threonine-protein kinase HipA
VSTGAWARPELPGPGEKAWPQVELSFPIGQARMLDAIVHLPLRTMAQQL